MAIVSIVLLFLREDVQASVVVKSLNAELIYPILAARAVEWMHLPTSATHLLAHNWDLMLVLSEDVQIPKAVTDHVEASYTIETSTTSIIPPNIREKNAELSTSEGVPPISFLHSPLRSVSSQFHQITPSLLAFADSQLCPKGPVLMLNYVSFHPWPQAAESYKKYLDGVKAGPMLRNGAQLRLSGAVRSTDLPEKGGWDQCVVAQYPSLKHFCDMGCDPEYQELNHRYRLPALKDLCILMVTEVDLDWTIPGSRKVESAIASRL